MKDFAKIPISSRGFDRGLAVEMHPEPIFHFSMGDRIPSEFGYKINSARRFHSAEFINFFQILEKYHPIMRLELGESILSVLPPERIVLYTDAFDVLFNDSLHSLLNYFLQVETLTPEDQFGRKPSIVFNGEKGCWPDPGLHHRYPHRNLATDHPYLNAGIMIGRAGAILEMLRRRVMTDDPHHGAFWKDVMVKMMKTDDQMFWSSVYLQSLVSPDFPRIEVDHHARFACCMFAQSSDVLAASNGIAFVRKTGVRPLLLHFNGPTKQAMASVATSLGYVLEPNGGSSQRNFSADPRYLG